MSEAKHTPGPWHVGDQGAGYPVRAEQPKWQGGGRAICACRPANRTNEAHQEAHANARLIAAAPELLAALEQALAVHGDHYSWGPDARAAIAKATGG